MVKVALYNAQPDPVGTVCKLPMSEFPRVKVNSPSPSDHVPTDGMVNKPSARRHTRKSHNLPLR